MGASYRSDSVHFLIFSSGDHSNPIRLSCEYLLMAICILQHYLPWHLDGAEEILVLFLSEPLIQCDLELVLHHLSLHWSQHSDQRNQTSAYQMEQKMPSIHCTNTRLCLICLWLQTSSQCLQVFPLYLPLLLAPPFVTAGDFLAAQGSVSSRLQRWFWVSPGNVLCGTGHTPEALCSPLLQTEPLARAVLPACLYKTSCTEALPQLGPRKHGYKTSYK